MVTEVFVNIAFTCSRVDNESLLFASPARVHAVRWCRRAEFSVSTAGGEKAAGMKVKAGDVC